MLRRWDGGFDRAARRHRGGRRCGIAKARGNGSAMRLACRARNIFASQRIEVSRHFCRTDWNAISCANCNRIGPAPCSMSGPPGAVRQARGGGAFAAASSRPSAGPSPSCSAAPPRDLLWECCRRCALGDVDEPSRSTVAGQRGRQGSSVLPMLKRHQDAFHQPTTCSTAPIHDSIPWLQTFLWPSDSCP